MSNAPTEPDHGDLARAPAGTPVSGAPSDNTTVIEVLHSFEQRGFTEQLIPLDGASIECGGCGTRSPAVSFSIEGARRLEGASDPDDMVTVIAARCPQCDKVGTVVLGYGPAASDNDADISAAFGAIQAEAAAEDRDPADRSWFGGSGDEEPDATR
jgi:hypothetical protein